MSSKLVYKQSAVLLHLWLEWMLWYLWSMSGRSSSKNSCRLNLARRGSLFWSSQWGRLDELLNLNPWKISDDRFGPVWRRLQTGKAEGVQKGAACGMWFLIDTSVENCGFYWTVQSRNQSRAVVLCLNFRCFLNLYSFVLLRCAPSFSTFESCHISPPRA